MRISLHSSSKAMFASLKALKCQSGAEKKLEEDVKQEQAHPQPLEAALLKPNPRNNKQKLTRRISRWKMESFPSEDNLTDALIGIPYNDISEGIKQSVTTVNIAREDGTLGITLRGGMLKNNQFNTPVVITQLKPDGPAAREGTIKVGDRLLAVNGVSLKGGTLAEAQALLKQPFPITALTIEYDVKVVELNENEPIIVEMEKVKDEEIGLILYQRNDGVYVKHIKRGSLADRCGALQNGDEIQAVNNKRIKGAQLQIDYIIQLLEVNVVRLEIVSQGNRTLHMPYNTLGKLEQNCNSIGFYNNGAVTHSEKLHVTLSRDQIGFGLNLTDLSDGTVIISNIQNNSPADRSGCLYPGDRLVAINHRSIALDMLTAKDVTALLDCSPGGRLALLVEFTVFDTVVPATGVFNVKLPRRGSRGLGLTISAGKANDYYVCEVKKGSSAHRAGSLLPGDRLLAVNGTSLDQCSAEQIIQILHQSDEITNLRVERSENAQDLRCHRKVNCTVELQRYGGPIGITIAGSEEPFQPITVSGLTPGGLAEQTGALMVGDEILAINHHNIIGEPLSTAHTLLQTSPDLVSLKISRFIVPNGRNGANMSPIQPPSVDSAVESWGSSHLDLTPSPEHLRSGPSYHNNCSNALNKNGNIQHSQLLDQITNENMNIQRELEILSHEIEDQSQNSQNDWNDDETCKRLDVVSTTNTAQEIEVISQQCKELDNHCCTNLTIDPHQQNYNNKSEEDKSHIHECHLRAPSEVENFHFSNLSESRQWQHLNASQASIRSEFQSYHLLTVVMKKDPVYEDFGFSVSDGLYERGVFINRIRKGGPADLSHLILPFDRILKVNETCTQDFDCCLTVPLIATAGEALTLVLARANQQVARSCDLYFQESFEEAKLNISPYLEDGNAIKRIVV